MCVGGREDGQGPSDLTLVTLCFSFLCMCVSPCCMYMCVQICTCVEVKGRMWDSLLYCSRPYSLEAESLAEQGACLSCSSFRPAINSDYPVAIHQNSDVTEGMPGFENEETNNQTTTTNPNYCHHTTTNSNKIMSDLCWRSSYLWLYGLFSQPRSLLHGSVIQICKKKQEEIGLKTYLSQITAAL